MKKKYCFYLFVSIFFLSLRLAYGQTGPGGYNTNLKLWLKGNAGVTINPALTVQTWTDQSANAFSATQATVTSRPAFNSTGINFNPSVQFDGSDDQLVVGSGIIGVSTINDVNVFLVAKTNTVTASSVFYEPQSASGRFNTHIPWSDNTLYWDAGSAASPQRISTPWTGSAGGSFLWTLTASTTSIPSTSGMGQEIYKNGLILASDNDMAAFTGSNSSMAIGNGFGFYNGEIAEMIVYTGALTNVLLQRIHSYLAIKYGITLNQSPAQNYIASDGTTVLWNGTTYSGYKNDIAGIGRDDNSILSQLKSTTINTPSDIIAIANSDFTTPGSFGSNLQFLMWGNNGLPTSADLTAAAIVHNGITIQSKSQRNWSTQVTGSPTGNAIVEVNMGIMNGPTGIGTNTNADVRLLIDNDATYGNSSAGEMVIFPTVGYSATGGKVYFTLPYTSIPAGQAYFSIGSANSSTCPLAGASPGGITVPTRIWLKADIGVTGSPPVQTWADQSGNGFAPTQGTVGQRPALLSGRINFNPSVQFDGTDDQLVAPAGIMGTAIYNNFNFFGVLRTNAVQMSSIFFETQSAGGRINIHIPWNDNTLYWDAGGAGSPQRLSTPWTGTAGISYLWSATASTTSIPTTSGAGQEIYKNGQLLASDNDMAGFTGANGAFYLGSNGGDHFNGEISEILITNGVMTTTQVRNIHSYLAAKYGITLDQTSPQNYTASDWNGTTGTKYWNATTAGAYKTDIAVIGRDDIGGLNQKQSQSINANILTIGNLAIAVDNPSNTNTFSADKSFFSFAHNNAAMSGVGVVDFGTTTNAEVIQARIARVWFAQETGTVTSLKLRFNLTTVPGVNDWINSRLLVDADGVFASGATSISPTAYNNATGIVDFDLDFTGATGYYFTIGSTNKVSTPLPIELVSFTAKTVDEGVKLSWITATELNNDYFSLENSVDGESWSEVTVVKGHGTTTVQSNYNYVDTQPVTGLSYYRLKQVDYDGVFKYSKIASANFEGLSLKMYPNPAVGSEVTFELSGDAISSGIAITTMSGMEIFRSPLSVTNQRAQKFTVNVDGYAPGIYIVTLYSAKGLQHTKLVVR